MSFVRYALVTVPMILLLGIASGRASDSGYGNPWFAALVKPEAMPPGWAFGAAWTILYVLMGFALAMILHAHGARLRTPAIALFGVQLLLNLSWSPLFFALHKVGTAYALLLLILVAATATTILFGRIRKAAAALMLPYLAWLCFASYLNAEIDRLNPAAESLVVGRGVTQIEL